MDTDPSIPFVLALDDKAATLGLVGGKGASLARMALAGFAVPPGFCVTTEAYRRFVAVYGLQTRIVELASQISTDQLASLDAASAQIQALFEHNPMPEDIGRAIREAYLAQHGDGQSVAVRSSATAEDLPGMSFAGQQDTYLNIWGEAAVLDAVKRCWASLWTVRAMGYRAHHGIASDEVSLAVVVQELVPAEAAGILFSANPFNGARDQVVINAAWGLGEAVVGGQVTPDTLILDKQSKKVVQQEVSTKEVMTVRTPEGTREEPVPEERRAQAVLSSAQASQLATLAVQIETLYGQPMDIEWALSQGCFYIVQARPITNLQEAALTPPVWNDSLDGNYLWTNGNLGEAVPDVMTPSTWSLIQIFIADTLPMLYIDGLAKHRPIGNIGGRFYMNLSLSASLAALFGMSRQRFVDINMEVFGYIPDALDIPRVPLSRWRILAVMLPAAFRLWPRVNANNKKLPAFLAEAPGRCEELRMRIQATSTAADLLKFWKRELAPYFCLCCQMLEAGARRGGNALVINRGKLRKMVGETDANALLSGQNSDKSYLASLDTLLGLVRLAHGEIDRETFAREYGHRSPHEFEVSFPRPAEDPAWIDRQLAGLSAAPVDVAALLTQQQQAREAAWQRFQQRYPRQISQARRWIEQALSAMHYREAARSEVVRVFWVLRAFILRTGELTGQEESIFFLSITEILDLLAGDSGAIASIPSRRAAYQRYSALPSYPMLIRGHFDPFKWAANEHRRNDLFDEDGECIALSDTVRGFPGAPGIVEGRVRLALTAEEGEKLQSGEVLVTTVTNVGWTPLFPRARAVVTDVGAPLSHAAIVARELGIPAVVGCGNATMRLHTGDLVRVNGELGTVEIVQNADV